MDEYEIYALVVKGTVDIQGLIAIQPSDDYQGIYIAWMCAAPQNNKHICKNPKYLGIGGHLFAIAAQKSVEYGYNGAMLGFASDMKMVKHYEQVFHAEHAPFLHPYQIIIDEENSLKIKEVYDYEWTDDKL